MQNYKPQIMEAEEARLLASKSRVYYIDDILNKIKAEAEKGLFLLYYYESLNKFQIEKLKKLGYNIITDDLRGETLHTISWAK